MRTILLIAVACLAALTIAAPPAGAIVPPRDCGFTKVKGKRYNIKADQMRCKTAKRHAIRYLRSGRRPSGYKCKDYSSRKRAMTFKCEDRPKTFFAIRR